MEEKYLLDALTDFERRVVKMVDGYFTRNESIHGIQILKDKNSEKNVFSSFYCCYNKKTGLHEFSPNKKVIGVAIGAASSKLGFIPNEISYNNVLLAYTRCRKIRYENSLNTK